jgi:hypothetical protein
MMEPSVRGPQRRLRVTWRGSIQSRSCCPMLSSLASNHLAPRRARLLTMPACRSDQHRRTAMAAVYPTTHRGHPLRSKVSMPSQSSLMIASKLLRVPPSAPTPPTVWHSGSHVVPAKPQAERETAIDILYENERGGFLCGKPLFSSAALGTLDPPAWSMSHRIQITRGTPILMYRSECIPQTLADKRLHSRSTRPGMGVGLVRVAHQPARGRRRGRMGVLVCFQR